MVFRCSRKLTSPLPCVVTCRPARSAQFTAITTRWTGKYPIPLWETGDVVRGPAEDSTCPPLSNRPTTPSTWGFIAAIPGFHQTGPQRRRRPRPSRGSCASIVARARTYPDASMTEERYPRAGTLAARRRRTITIRYIDRRIDYASGERSYCLSAEHQRDGIFIRTDHPSRVGTRLRLRFQVSTANRSRSKAKSVDQIHCARSGDNSQPRHGCAFHRAVARQTCKKVVGLVPPPSAYLHDDDRQRRRASLKPAPRAWFRVLTKANELKTRRAASCSSTLSALTETSPRGHGPAVVDVE